MTSGKLRVLNWAWKGADVCNRGAITPHLIMAWRKLTQRDDAYCDRFEYFSIHKRSQLTSSHRKVARKRIVQTSLWYHRKMTHLERNFDKDSDYHCEKISLNPGKLLVKSQFTWIHETSLKLWTSKKNTPLPPTSAFLRLYIMTIVTCPFKL